MDKALREKFLRECLPKMNAASATNAVFVVTSFVSNLTGYNKKKVSQITNAETVGTFMILDYITEF